MFEKIQVKELFKSFAINGSNITINDVRPLLVDGVGLCICKKGRCDFVLEDKEYTLEEGVLFTFFPHVVLKFTKISSDFEAIIAVSTSNFFYSLNIDDASRIFFKIKDNPCVKLSEVETGDLLNLIENTEYFYFKQDNPYKIEITERLMTSIAFLMVTYYFKNVGQFPVCKENRKERIYRRFMQLVYDNYKISKEVSFYSEKLCISPRYLTAICNEISCRSAKQWIDNIVTANAKHLLLYSSYTVQQISDIMGFANPSFFGQFFKKNTGLTPFKYRKVQAPSVV